MGATACVHLDGVGQPLNAMPQVGAHTQSKACSLYWPRDPGRLPRITGLPPLGGLPDASHSPSPPLPPSFQRRSARRTAPAAAAAAAHVVRPIPSTLHPSPPFAQQQRRRPAAGPVPRFGPGRHGGQTASGKSGRAQALFRAREPGNPGACGPAGASLGGDATRVRMPLKICECCARWRRFRLARRVVLLAKVETLRCIGFHIFLGPRPTPMPH